MRRKSKTVFGILVREHELGLLAFVHSCVDDPAAAEDVVQDTFLAAWRQLGSYNRQRPLAAWLRGIAKNKILEHFRNRATACRHLALIAPDTIEEIAQGHKRLSAAGGPLPRFPFDVRMFGRFDFWTFPALPSTLVPLILCPLAALRRFVASSPRLDVSFILPPSSFSSCEGRRADHRVFGDVL